MPNFSCVVWLTGYPAAGKTTIAVELAKQLRICGRAVCLVDGDELRKGVCRDLGFSLADRSENVRRAAELAKLVAESGVIVVTALISPLESDRQMARHIIGTKNFIEVFVDTPLATCMERDPKQHYAKAKQGLIEKFTGINSPYEAPRSPDFHLDTMTATAQSLAEKVAADVLRRVRP